MINNFAKNLKYFRNLYKISQQKVAECLNVDQSLISLWESSKCEPSLDMLIELTKLFNCTLEELVMEK